MRRWKKHPKKEHEAVLKEFDAHGWRIGDPPTYYTLRCPCGEHQRQYHLTPSGRYFGNKMLQWARNLPCWAKKEEK